MYKLILVDDEKIIREGIASIIDWQQHGFSLEGTASNGLEALTLIKKSKPNVVITDIKMPIIDGIKLIAKAKAIDMDIKFVVLSGYSEFDYAHTAMKYGVKHYLIKPCNENSIIKALTEIKAKLNKTAKDQTLLNNVQTRLNKIMPLWQEYFLRDYLSGIKYDYKELTNYKLLLDINGLKLNLILLAIYKEFADYSIKILKYHLDKLKIANIIHSYTNIDNKIILLVKSSSLKTIKQEIDLIKFNLFIKCNLELVVLYSENGYFEDVQKMYSKTNQKLDQQLNMLNPDKNSNLFNIDSIYKLTEKDQIYTNPLKYNSLVNKIIINTYKYFEDENFSLKWLAKNIIFMDEGYLSKVFKRAIGENFSKYLFKLRMEKAVSLIKKTEEHRVYEVASKVGLGLNPQYFSQLFKKYTGFTPTEYKKISNVKNSING